MAINPAMHAFSGDFAGSILAINDDVIVCRDYALLASGSPGITGAEILFVPLTSLPCWKPSDRAAHTIRVMEMDDPEWSLNSAVFSSCGRHLYFLVKNPALGDSVIYRVTSENGQFAAATTHEKYPLRVDLSNMDVWLTFNHGLKMVSRDPESSSMQLHSLDLEDNPERIAQANDVTPEGSSELQLVEKGLSDDDGGMILTERGGLNLLLLPGGQNLEEGEFTCCFLPMHAPSAYIVECKPVNHLPHFTLTVHDLLGGRPKRAFLLEKQMQPPAGGGGFSMQLLRNLFSLNPTIRGIFANPFVQGVIQAVQGPPLNGGAPAQPPMASAIGGFFQLVRLGVQQLWTTAAPAVVANADDENQNPAEPDPASPEAIARKRDELKSVLEFIKLHVAPDQGRVVVNVMGFSIFMVDLKRDVPMASLEERAAESCWRLLPPETRLQHIKMAAEKGFPDVSRLKYIYLCCGEPQ